MVVQPPPEGGTPEEADVRILNHGGYPLGAEVQRIKAVGEVY